ncbi:MAG: tRNA (adenosine(37)-N6)-dimethylallyltransferase MiaA [Candidatus Aegiribacteria sp.]|nr:tRNA (adenosine(37)-N6)-dimethylallyltransferase MiaA [Candidatus Aegiribacteria sp.]
MAGNSVVLIPVLTGCTASGKTGILLELSNRHSIEIINADSRQVYRGMDIGTAKPSLKEQSQLTHHLLDQIDPDEVFSAGMFLDKARELIIQIDTRGSVPLIAGGTALYILALTGFLDEMPPRCDEIREGLKLFENERPGILFEILHRVDPELADKIGDSDKRRQVRALEIYFQSGKPPSSFRKGGDPSERQKYLIAGISIPRDEHRRRIRRRAIKMLDAGLIDEVEALLSAGWGRNSALGRTIGYSEVLAFLDGSISTEDGIIDAISINTWRLVRRQKNMFRRIEGINWMEDDPDLIDEFLFAEGGL